MKEYEIKISGSGTMAELIAALLGVIEGLPDACPDGLPSRWEDSTLFTQVSEKR